MTSSARYGVACPDHADHAIEARIAAHVQRVDDRLTFELDQLHAAWEPTSIASSPLYDVDLPGRLLELLGRGGKRIRPVMALLGWLAADVRHEQAGYEDMMGAATAIELLHCFAIVHDDVMDESATRRGRPTVHESAAQLHLRHGGRGESARFGDSIAMLVGDLAHSEAERLAAALPPPMRRIWQQMVLELIAGQTWDVVGSAAGDRRPSFARRVARHKTGYYTVARPLQLGAAAARGGDAAVTALGAFGRHAGEAFALRDDMLGAYGDPLATGKPAGDDIRAGKPTVLLAIAAETLRGPAADALRAAGSAAMTDDQVLLVQTAMRRHGVVARVEAMIDERIADALAALECDDLSADGVVALDRMLDQLACRGN